MAKRRPATFSTANGWILAKGRCLMDAVPLREEVANCSMNCQRRRVWRFVQSIRAQVCSYSSVEDAVQG